jgi:AraC-like DNA-binding protein
MAGSIISICNEPDEFEAGLGHGGHVELWVTRPGPFRARLTRVALPHSTLLVIEETAPRVAFISPAPDAVVVVVPLDGESHQIWAGTPLRSGAILTISRGQPVHAQTMGPCRTGIVCFAAPDFARFTDGLIGSNFSLPAGVQLWHVAPSALRSFTRLYLATIHANSAHPIAPAYVDAARDLEHELTSALLECLSGQPLKAPTAKRQRHLTLMTRFEAVLRAQPDCLPVAVNVCTALGVSLRTLQTCCRKHLGMPPGRYFHFRQLHRVHHALRGADPTRTTVSAIARRYGVTELGRFAGNYRALFGEHPSATMQRVPSPERRARDAHSIQPGH